jgi:hypothetical protein
VQGGNFCSRLTTLCGRVDTVGSCQPLAAVRGENEQNRCQGSRS